jgi:hypothetical protein
MKHWNHRVVQFYDGTLGICEVHYKDEGDEHPFAITSATGVVSESIVGLASVLEMMRLALDKPILITDERGNICQ